MINNNQYSYPEKSHQKNGITYADISSALYRKNDSTDNNQSFRPGSGRNPNNHGITANLPIKKSGGNLDEISPNFRPPTYPNMKPFIHSPKNNSSSSSNLSNFSTVNTRRGSFNSGLPIDPKQTQNNNQSHTNNTGTFSFDVKDIQEKVQTLVLGFKQSEKRIVQLQKNNGNNNNNNSQFLQINSGIKNDESAKNNLEIYSSLLTKFELQWNIQLKKIKDDINLLRQEIQHQPKDKQIHQKQQIRFNSQNKNNSNNSLELLVNNVSNDMQKKTDIVKKQLQGKLQRNNQFLTSIIGRLQRQMLNTIGQINPSYKASAIKCSGSAILLRFVQCFKVRKNSVVSQNKGGQIKIIMTDNTYYIDNQGFLLDKQQHYLIDQRGNQVRLDEKHVKMLQEQKVLI